MDAVQPLVLATRFPLCSRCRHRKPTKQTTRTHNKHATARDNTTHSQLSFFACPRLRSLEVQPGLQQQQQAIWLTKSLDLAALLFLPVPGSLVCLRPPARASSSPHVHARLKLVVAWMGRSQVVDRRREAASPSALSWLPCLVVALEEAGRFSFTHNHTHTPTHLQDNDHLLRFV